MVVRKTMNKESILYLRSPDTIRQHCQQIFSFVESGNSDYWQINIDKLDKVVDYVLKQIHENYPDGEIPIIAGGVILIVIVLTEIKF